MLYDMEPAKKLIFKEEATPTVYPANVNITDSTV